MHMHQLSTVLAWCMTCPDKGGMQPYPHICPESTTEYMHPIISNLQIPSFLFLLFTMVNHWSLFV